MNETILNKLLTLVTDIATEEYIANESEMLLDINFWVTNPENTKKYIRDNNVEILLNNHRNHHGFISEILISRDGSALIKALPWVYHSYHSQGIPYEYFHDVLHAWKGIIYGHLSKESSTCIIPLYDWMLSVHQNCIDQCNFHQSIIPKEEYTPFLNAVLKGNQREAFAYAKEQVTNWSEFLHFFEDSIQPALYEVGALWENGEISIANEHMATETCNRILSTLILLIELPKCTKEKVLVSTTGNEYHQIGAWMVATAIEADGWDVDFIGTSSPIDDLLKQIERGQYKVFLLSVTMPYNIHIAKDMIKRIKEMFPEIKVVVGGQAFGFFSDTPKELLCDLVVNSYTEAVAALNSWFYQGKNEGK